MQTLSVKIIKSESGHGTIDRIINAFREMLETGSRYYAIEYHPQLHIEDIEDTLNKTFKDDIETRRGASGGCYGARTGGTYEDSLQVYIDSSLFPSRFLDSDFDEIVNLESLCNEYGEKLDIDPDNHRESMESMGIDSKSDNTYNYLGHNSSDPQPLCHANIEVFNTDQDSDSQPVTAIVKFHCGGDIRGNYSREVVYKFNDIYELYNALSPNLVLLDEENIEEIARLKDLIQKDPADRELLIKELKEIIG